MNCGTHPPLDASRLRPSSMGMSVLHLVAVGFVFTDRESSLVGAVLMNRDC